MVEELRPRGAGEILDAAVALWRARLGPLLRVTLLVVVPVAAVASLILLSALPDDYSIDTDDGVTSIQVREGDETVLVVGLFGFLLLWAAATSFVLAVTTRIVADAYVASAETSRAAARAVAHRIPALVASTIVLALGTGVGLALGYVPGIAIAAFWSVAIPALVLEEVGPFKALGRSFHLTRSHFWTALAVFWSSVLLAVALSYGLTLLLDLAVQETDPLAVRVLAQSFANAVAAAVSVPVAATALVALYFDLRIRKEGFDVQLMLTQLDDRHATTSPTAGTCNSTTA